VIARLLAARWSGNDWPVYDRGRGYRQVPGCFIS